jgi:DNA-binding SARP family transcriptional activator
MKPRQWILCGNQPDFLQTVAQRCGTRFDIASFPSNCTVQNIISDAADAVALAFHVSKIPDGIDMICKIKRGLPSLPCIVFSDDFSGQAIRLLFKAGASDVLPTPPDPCQIQAALDGFTPLNKVVHPEVSRADEPSIEVRFFGPFSFKINEIALELPNISRQILALLAVQYPAPVGRMQILRNIWPDRYRVAPSSVQKGLNVEIHRIRKAFQSAGLAPDMLLFRQDQYSLASGLCWHSDIELFKSTYALLADQLAHQMVEEAPLQALMKLYAGQFLADMPDASSSWAIPIQHHYFTMFEQIADQFTSLLYDSEAYRQCACVCKELLVVEPRLETIHLRLMDCFLQLGKSDLAEKQYGLCCRILEGS